jgi:lipopolysaccharide/colanic/teichoic acid biosynthesis glycosyltransferase
VLRGDMSLVGPRPEMPRLVSQYEPWQHKRFEVPQGITGWWQVNGRSDKPMHLNTEDDLYYIQNYSLWMDLFILIKTPLVVVRGKGAF